MKDVAMNPQTWQFLVFNCFGFITFVSVSGHDMCEMFDFQLLA